MKKITALLIATALSFSIFAQEIETHSLDNLDDSQDYDSYAFLSNRGEPDKSDKKGVTLEQTTVVTPENEKWAMVEYRTTGWEDAYPEENKIIKDAISYELDVRDLDKDRSDPDILIQYHIYDSDYVNDDRYINAVDDYRFTYTKKQDLMSNLDDGTVVLSVIDTEEGASVWEGFAYNAYDENDSYDERQQGLRQAVDALMERFAAEGS